VSPARFVRQLRLVSPSSFADLVTQNGFSWQKSRVFLQSIHSSPIGSFKNLIAFLERRPSASAKHVAGGGFLENVRPALFSSARWMRHVVRMQRTDLSAWRPVTAQRFAHVHGFPRASGVPSQFSWIPRGNSNTDEGRLAINVPPARETFCRASSPSDRAEQAAGTAECARSCASGCRRLRRPEGCSSLVLRSQTTRCAAGGEPPALRGRRKSFARSGQLQICRSNERYWMASETCPEV